MTTMRANIYNHSRCIFPTPHFIVDKHLTGMERNIETEGRKGEFHFETRVWDNDFISQLTKKNQNFVSVL